MKDNILKLIISIFLLSSFISHLPATEQIRDKFISDTDEIYNIYGGYPLRGFFEDNPERRPSTDLTITSLWRGYIAYFRISQESLYLVDVCIPDERGNRFVSIMDEVFIGEEIILADWYTGSVAFPLQIENDDGKGLFVEFIIEDGKVIGQERSERYHDLVVWTKKSLIDNRK